MSRPDIETIRSKLAAADVVSYRNWGKDEVDAEYDIEQLLAYIEQLERQNAVMREALELIKQGPQSKLVHYWVISALAECDKEADK